MNRVTVCADRTRHRWKTIPASIARHIDNASPT